MEFSLALSLAGGAQIFKGLGDARRVDAVAVSGFTLNATDLTPNSPTSFMPLSITKPVDAASPLLMQALAADQRIVTVTLSSLSSDVSYLFQDANLLSVSHALVSGFLAETISLSFHSLSISSRSNGKSNSALVVGGKIANPVAAAASSIVSNMSAMPSPTRASMSMSHKSDEVKASASVRASASVSMANKGFSTTKREEKATSISKPMAPLPTTTKVTSKIVEPVKSKSSSMTTTTRK